MYSKCEHQLKLENTWLSGPHIVCQRCGRSWEVRGKTLADACCWGMEILAVVLCPLLFGNAMQAFASYGWLSSWLGYALICLIIGPCLIAAHFGIFALGHTAHGWVIRRSGDLQRWRVEEPYHSET